ncbi:MAG: M20/M25/M40 family metallo-hydrolase [Opitutales bacterium]
MTDALDFLRTYTSFPSVSTDPAFAEGMDGARTFLARQLERLGFAVETVPTALHPILLAQRGKPGDPHVVIYSHYDVQPADPLELWTTPAFEASVRDGRIYARGAADNKGPTTVQFFGLKRLLELRPDLPLRITWLIEGEEETGSPSIPKFLAERGAEIGEADMIVMSDTGSMSPEQITLTTALRGLVGAEVRVTGPRVDLHSGVHGGAVRNPVQALAKLLATLHNDDGTVNLPGFYDGVVPPHAWEREQLARLSTSEAAYRDFLGVPEFFTASGLSPFEATRFAPTLEFNGIGGGYQGSGSKTIIPSHAFAKITCRLVANQDASAVAASLKAALQERCPRGCTVEAKAEVGGAPYLVVPPHRPNTPADQPRRLAAAFEAADAAIAAHFGSPPLYLREGGSVPIIGQLKAATGLEAVMIGLFCPEDNLHAPDESMSLNMIERGIAAYEQLFEAIADAG